MPSQLPQPLPKSWQFFRKIALRLPMVMGMLHAFGTALLPATHTAFRFARCYVFLVSLSYISLATPGGDSRFELVNFGAIRANYSVKWTAALGRGIFVRIVAAATYLKR